MIEKWLKADNIRATSNYLISFYVKNIILQALVPNDC